MGPLRLLVDIGNSRIKWALASHGTWLIGESFETDAQTLRGHLQAHWLPLDRPVAVWVSNVAGPAVFAELHRWVSDVWACPVSAAQSQSRQGGVTNGYETPERLGVDRWLGLLGLRQRHPLPACLVDSGTAITVDVLDEAGFHLGGLIAPGLKTMKHALQADTYALDIVTGPAPGPVVLGRDTASAMDSGCVLACAGLIEKALGSLTDTTAKKCTLVMTGGDAALIGRHLSIPFQLDDTIVLHGLQIMAEGDL